MKRLDYRPFYRRNLPHMQPAGSSIFITFRLAGSLPKAILDDLTERKTRLLALLTAANLAERSKLELAHKRECFRRYESCLDKAASGPLWLKDERVARVVMDALQFMDKKVFGLNAACIMANHVHAVITPLPVTQSSGLRASRQSFAQAEPAVRNPEDCVTTGAALYHSLPSIMHSLKGYTSSQCNRIIGRRGQFWERETYDHYIRNEAEFGRVIHYVLNNPVKAGLCKRWEDWQWSYFESQK